MIITAGGENIPPIIIEDQIKETIPLVSNCMLIGDKVFLSFFFLSFFSFLFFSFLFFHLLLKCNKKKNNRENF